MTNLDTEAALRELATLKRIVDGFIMTSEVLHGYELHTLMIKPIELKEISLLEKDAALHELKSGKICYDDNGNPYVYYGPNGCP